jgi:hypothetical protein
MGIVAPYVLRVLFNDGEESTIDFRPLLDGELYGPLRDLSLFNQVQIDKGVHTLVWPNGADFDPADLHDWDEGSEGFRLLANNWKTALAPDNESL